MQKSTQFKQLLPLAYLNGCHLKFKLLTLDGKTLEEDETNSFGVQITNKFSTCTHFMLASTKWIALTNSELRTDVGGEIA